MTDPTPSNKPNRIKGLWNAHKGKLAVVATLTTIGFAALNVRNLRITNEFLDDKGLLEEWQTLEDDTITEN